MQPHWLVDDIETAAAAAAEAGAVVAHRPLEITGQGTFAIFIEGDIQHGLCSGSATTPRGAMPVSFAVTQR